MQVNMLKGCLLHVSVRHKQTTNTAAASTFKYVLQCQLFSNSWAPWPCQPEWSLVVIS